ncbi:MAG: hypothetical protein A2927_02725 [Candidatus Komeilibacteria bacterium RIFCSPLOWO2_01_FULL_45_10]|uniref:Vitamin K epoxide reductase domain-containing protein n=1 Tax=Candidatus Komeilibacteria bacterium RIFCSPLOWO2_01_FULL_45_10 TaxID=1798550 RepID=A0A1G2BNT8_9BACT|nr:MAG: hypothetical protein A2927_02725 [Candidatus Komeilibacteria bacterium RIFCSPLOWO2_01_FULL_45_10]
MNLTDILFLLTALGLLNAAYLYWQHWQYQEKSRPMFCPIGGRCEEVVQSKYARTFGVSNDLGGILFYLVLAGLLALNQSTFNQEIIVKLMVLAVFGGFVFSTYLLYVQFFILKKFCTWCLIANLINYAIFIIVLILFV